MQLLKEANDTDPERSPLLLYAEYKEFGYTTCMELADITDNKKLITHPASQIVLNDAWTGKMTNNNTNLNVWKIL